MRESRKQTREWHERCIASIVAPGEVSGMLERFLLLLIFGTTLRLEHGTRFTPR